MNLNTFYPRKKFQNKKLFNFAKINMIIDQITSLLVNSIIVMSILQDNDVANIYDSTFNTRLYLARLD